VYLSAFASLCSRKTVRCSHLVLLVHLRRYITVWYSHILLISPRSYQLRNSVVLTSCSPRTPVQLHNSLALTFPSPHTPVHNYQLYVTVWYSHLLLCSYITGGGVRKKSEAEVMLAHGLTQLQKSQKPNASYVQPEQGSPMQERSPTSQATSQKLNASYVQPERCVEGLLGSRQCLCVRACVCVCVAWEPSCLAKAGQKWNVELKIHLAMWATIERKRGKYRGWGGERKARHNNIRAGYAWVCVNVCVCADVWITG
jgi:hypothetical protein